MLRHGRRQRRVGAALAVEVGPHRQHDDRPPAGDRGGVDQVGEEGLAGRRVVAEREDLLELVDQQHHPPRRRGVAEGQPGGQVERVLLGPQRAHQALDRDGRRLAAVEPRQRDGQAFERVVPRPEDGDGPLGAAVELAPPQGGDQPGLGQRRLAAARGAQDRQEPVLLARGEGRSLKTSSCVNRSRPKKKWACRSSKLSSPR